MKILLSQKAKKDITTLIILILIGIVVIKVVSLFFNTESIKVFASSTMVDKYKIRSQLLMEATDSIGVCSAEEAVKVWASGLEKRSAALQYSVMTKELKNIYAKQLEKAFPNWVTGMSSPWVESFKIVKTENPNSNNYIFHLCFSTATSTGPAGDFNAAITVTKEGSFWRITKILADKELYAYTGFDPNKI